MRPRNLRNRTPEQERLEQLSMCIYNRMLGRDIPYQNEQLATATPSELTEANQRALNLYRETQGREYAQ